MKFGFFSKSRGTFTDGQAAMSLLEVLVAMAILAVIAVYVSNSFVDNLAARQRNERQVKFMSVDAALRSAVFRRLSVFAEKAPNCAKPKASLTNLWKGADQREVRLLPLTKLQAGRHPPAMVRRCQRQSTEVPLTRGVFTCFELRASRGGGGEGRRFLAEHEAFAETFFAFWDAARGRSTTCSAFSDVLTPVRGAQLHYVLYWRPRAVNKKPGGEQRFSSFAGTMYGQTKASD